MTKNYQYKTGDLYHSRDFGIILLCLKKLKTSLIYNNFYFHVDTFIMPDLKFMTTFLEKGDIKLNE